MFKRYKLILALIPWFLLLIALLLWSLGVELPSFRNNQYAVQNTSVILERIEELGKLELVRYNFREIYDYQAISKGKIRGNTSLGVYEFGPDLKVALIASGEAVGCIDFLKIDPENILLQPDTLYLRLPEPEICYHKLDMEKSRIYDFERSGFWSNIFPDDDEVTHTVENAYREAERQIKVSALQDGILDQTIVNAEKVLKPMLEKIADRPVVFTYTLPKSLLNPSMHD